MRLKKSNRKALQAHKVNVYVEAFKFHLTRKPQTKPTGFERRMVRKRKLRWKQLRSYITIPKGRS